MLGAATRTALFSRLFGRYRFPQVFAVLAGLLILDLFLPDPIPFLDEMVLAILTLFVGMWKKRSDEPAIPKPPMKDVTPRGEHLRDP